MKHCAADKQINAVSGRTPLSSRLSHHSRLFVKRLIGHYICRRWALYVNKIWIEVIESTKMLKQGNEKTYQKWWTCSSKNVCRIVAKTRRWSSVVWWITVFPLVELKSRRSLPCAQSAFGLLRASDNTSWRFTVNDCFQLFQLILTTHSNFCSPHTQFVAWLKRHFHAFHDFNYEFWRWILLC